MYRLFNKPSPHLADNIAPQLNQIKQAIFNRYSQQWSYYKEYPQAIGNTHILMGICDVLLSYIYQSADDSYRRVNDSLFDITSPLNIGSDVNTSKVFRGMFGTEFSLLLSTSFTPLLGISDWCKIRPVRFLTHSWTDVQLLPIDLNKANAEGLSVVGIDLPLLAYQLYSWYEENKIKQLEQDISSFITAYILPAMIPEQTDIAIRNRLQFIGKEEVILDSDVFSKTMDSYTDTLDGMYSHILNGVNAIKGSDTYIKQLSVIPMIFKRNYYSAVPRDLTSYSPTNYWIMVYVYLDWIYRVCEVIDFSSNSISNIHQTLYRVEQMMSSLSVLSNIPLELRIDFKTKYQKIKGVFK